MSGARGVTDTRDTRGPAGASGATGEEGETGAGGATGEQAPRLDALQGVFIVGVARSGTSLLKALLDGHPELWVPPAESFAIDWCRAPDPAAAFLALPRYAQMFPEDSRERRLVRLAFAARQPISTPAQGVTAFLHAMAAVRPPQPGARRWVEKTPKHLRAAPHFLAEFGPGTRVLAVVRDPRAVLASQARRWDRGRTPAGMRHFARRWATGDRLVRTGLRQWPQQFLAVRYEDLVAAPAPVMQSVARHLGIAWNEVLVQPTREARPWGGNSSYGTDPQGAAQVSGNSRERYLDELPPALVRDVARLLAPRMRHWGYDPQVAAAGPRRWWLELSAARAARAGLATSPDRSADASDG